MKKRRFEGQLKRVLAATAVCLLAAWPAMGQISYKAVDKHEQLKRQSLREANQAEASSYKDSHLNMNAYTFKKGGLGRAERRSLTGLLRPIDAPDEKQLRKSQAGREKKKFRLFRKREK